MLDEHREAAELYVRAGIRTHRGRIDFASAVVGRRIEWGAELTPAECAQVRAALIAGITEDKGG